MNYSDLKNINRSTADIVRPPPEISVSDAAEKYLYIYNPGGTSGYFRKNLVPYLIEPMDNLNSYDYEGLIFVGPARTGKTQGLVDGCFAYAVTCDQSDLIIYHGSDKALKKYHNLRTLRMVNHSPEIKKNLIDDRNAITEKIIQFDLHSVMMGIPVVNDVSSQGYKRVFATDYDRFPLDVDGQGSAFDLIKKRTQVYLSAGMTAAESSPGYLVTDRDWKPSTPHEAPPTQGILALYNRGDRRRWYWKCPHCREYFEPTFEYLHYKEDLPDLYEVAQSVYMACPVNGCVIKPEHKKKLNKGGKWLAEGQRIVRGRIVGSARKSNIVSYWMQGPAAAFQTWQGLVLNYLQAKKEYEETGNFNALKTTTNLDQGCPFTPPAGENHRDPHALENRKDKTIKKRIVPKWVRFLIATVDVQGNRFDVQIQGTGPCETLDGVETVIVDRFPLRYSHRYDANGKSKPMDPGRYVEDWRILVEKVINKTYEVEGHEKEMPVLMTFCDSGGGGDTTDNSYTFYRFLRSEKLHKKFMLVKGTGNMNAPRIELKYPDNRNRKDRKAQARGDVPVLFFNSNKLKDKVSKDLEREDPGPGFYHFPDFLKDEYFKGLTCEVRDDKTGKWECPSGARNEPFDHAQYHYGATLFLKVESINWNKPPNWAKQWKTQNEISKEKPKSVQNKRGSFVKRWKY